jgi:hypothetical protein
VINNGWISEIFKNTRGMAEFSSNVELKCTKGVLDQYSIEILAYSYLISMGHLF